MASTNDMMTASDESSSLFSQITDMIAGVGSAVGNVYSNVANSNNQLETQKNQQQTILIIGALIVAVLLLKK